MTLSRRIMLPILGAALIAFCVAFIMSAFMRSRAVAGKDGSDGAALVKQSSEKFYVDFTGGFRDSSVKSCVRVATAGIAADSRKRATIDNLCHCASERVLDRLTIADVRVAMSGNDDDLKTRFKAAAATCIAEYHANTPPPPGPPPHP